MLDMQLYLVDNDPLHTLLVSQDGQPLYQVLTPSAHCHASSPDSASSDSSAVSSPSRPSSQGTSHSPCSSTSSSFSFIPTKLIPSPPRHSARQFISAPASAVSSPQPTHHRPSIDRINSNAPNPVARTHSSPHLHHHHQHLGSPSPHPFSAVPPSQLSSPPTPSDSASAGRGPVTTIKRLERHQFNRGNVETEVGRIEYCGEHVGIRVQLCHIGMEICAPTVKRISNSAAVSGSQSLSRRNGDSATALQAFVDHCEKSKQEKENPVLVKSRAEVGIEEEESFTPDPIWEFIGPDTKPYKWMSLARCPVLVHDTQPVPTPVARYRSARLGIVSRSRKGSLEILPAGLDIEDFIVVTFVGYFRMKLGEVRGYFGRHVTHDLLSPPSSTQAPPSAESPEILAYQQGLRRKDASADGGRRHYAMSDG